MINCSVDRLVRANFETCPKAMLPLFTVVVSLADITIIVVHFPIRTLVG